jgi:glutamate dehydrogenase/leucine dehydrogenase
MPDADVTAAPTKTTVAPLSPYAMAVEQFQTAADRLGVNNGLSSILSQPKRELTVHFPVMMDNGEVEVLTGHRVQHNMARGPGKGGSGFIRTSRWTRSKRWRCG